MGCPIPSRTATASWKDSAAAGGERSVVKPEANLVGSRKGLVRPGRKVRGREYLRIIYDPTTPNRATWTSSVSKGGDTSVRRLLASRPLASRVWTGSLAGNRCGGSTSARSRCSPLNPNPSTPGVGGPVASWQGAVPRECQLWTTSLGGVWQGLPQHRAASRGGLARRCCTVAAPQLCQGVALRG